MLKFRFNPDNPFTYFRYGRMSSDRQNPSSPDRQFKEIERVRAQCNYPWRVIGTYRDDALTGKKLLRRPGLQLMLNDIKSRKKKPDLILIDNFERFGRIEEMESLARNLFRKFGILILTADTRFADPTTQHGKVYRAFESFRATSANELKSSEVFSGKRLLIEEKKFWPGGEAPFGYQLQAEMGEKKGRPCVVGHLLVPEPEAFLVAKKIFALARSTGWGSKRVTRAVNADPTVPDKFKPLNAVNVGYMLKNDIYAGILIWGNDLVNHAGENAGFIEREEAPGTAIGTARDASSGSRCCGEGGLQEGAAVESEARLHSGPARFGL